VLVLFESNLYLTESELSTYLLTDEQKTACFTEITLADSSTGYLVKAKNPDALYIELVSNTVNPSHALEIMNLASKEKKIQVTVTNDASHEAFQKTLLGRSSLSKEISHILHKGNSHLSILYSPEVLEKTEQKVTEKLITTPEEILSEYPAVKNVVLGLSSNWYYSHDFLIASPLPEWEKTITDLVTYKDETIGLMKYLENVNEEVQEWYDTNSPQRLFVYANNPELLEREDPFIFSPSQPSEFRVTQTPDLSNIDISKQYNNSFFTLPQGTEYFAQELFHERTLSFDTVPANEVIEISQVTPFRSKISLSENTVLQPVYQLNSEGVFEYQGNSVPNTESLYTKEVYEIPSKTWSSFIGITEDLDLTTNDFFGGTEETAPSLILTVQPKTGYQQKIRIIGTSSPLLEKTVSALVSSLWKQTVYEKIPKNTFDTDTWNYLFHDMGEKLCILPETEQRIEELEGVSEETKQLLRELCTEEQYRAFVSTSDTMFLETDSASWSVLNGGEKTLTIHKTVSGNLNETNLDAITATDLNKRSSAFVTQETVSNNLFGTHTPDSKTILDPETGKLYIQTISKETDKDSLEHSSRNKISLRPYDTNLYTLEQISPVFSVLNDLIEKKGMSESEARAKINEVFGFTPDTQFETTPECKSTVIATLTFFEALFGKDLWPNLRKHELSGGEKFLWELIIHPSWEGSVAFDYGVSGLLSNYLIESFNFSSGGIFWRVQMRTPSKTAEEYNDQIDIRTEFYTHLTEFFAQVIQNPTISLETKEKAINKLVSVFTVHAPEVEKAEKMQELFLSGVTDDDFDNGEIHAGIYGGDNSYKGEELPSYHGHVAAYDYVSLWGDYYSTTTTPLDNWRLVMMTMNNLLQSMVSESGSTTEEHIEHLSSVPITRVSLEIDYGEGDFMVPETDSYYLRGTVFSPFKFDRWLKGSTFASSVPLENDASKIEIQSYIDGGIQEREEFLNVSAGTNLLSLLSYPLGNSAENYTMILCKIYDASGKLQEITIAKPSKPIFHHFTF
jgi:hypothetical protein